MFDVKLEIEGYTGQKINLDKQLDQVEKAIKASGGKLNKDEMKNIRKILKKKEKRLNHKAMHMANCLEFGMTYNADEEELLFSSQYMAKHGDDKDTDDKEEICVPFRGIHWSYSGSLWSISLCCSHPYL